MENGNKGVHACGVFLHGCRRQSHRAFLALLLTLTAGLMAGNAVASEMSLLVNGKAIHVNVPPGKNLNEKNRRLNWVITDMSVLNRKQLANE